MSVIEVEVRRKSDGKLVYGNTGNRAIFESMYDADMAKFDPAEHVITKIDVTAKFSADAKRVTDKAAALVRLKAIDTTKALPANALKTLIEALQ